MCRFPFLRRMWWLRLVGAALFLLAVAAIAQAVRDPGSAPRDDAELGSSVTYAPTPSVAEVDVRRVLTFEGTTIVVSAGPWTPQDIHAKLVENGLDAYLGADLTVRVQSAYPPTRVEWSMEGALRRPTLWLDAWPGSAFTRMPDATIAHQIGRLWVARYGREDFWSEYGRARGVAVDQELVADDYRLLFGSEEAVAQMPHHVERSLVDPRSITTLRDLFIRFARPA